MNLRNLLNSKFFARFHRILPMLLLCGPSKLEWELVSRRLKFHWLLLLVQAFLRGDRWAGFLENNSITIRVSKASSKEFSTKIFSYERWNGNIFQNKSHTYLKKISWAIEWLYFYWIKFVTCKIGFEGRVWLRSSD